MKSILKSAQYRWWILFIGVLAQMVFSMMFSGIPVSALQLREGYQLSIEQLGLVLGGLGLGVAASEIVWGAATDKLGDRRVLMVGLLSMGMTFLVLAWLFVPESGRAPETLWLWLAGLLACAGVFAGSINATSGRAVMSWFKDGERGFAMSIRQTAIPVGGALGTVLIPWTAGQHGLRSAFLVLAGLGLGMAALVWLWLIEAEPAPVTAQGTGPSASPLASPLSRWAVWKFALAGALLTVPQMSVLTFATVFLTDHQHLSLTAIAVTLVAVQLGGAVLRIATGRYSDRHRNRRQIMRIIAVLAGVAGIGLAALTELGGMPALLMLMLLGLFGHAWHGVAFTEIAVMSGVQHAGKALGMMGTMVFATMFVSAAAIPHVLRLSSWSLVWLLVGVVTLCALPLLVEPRTPKT